MASAQPAWKSENCLMNEANFIPPPIDYSHATLMEHLADNIEDFSTRHMHVCRISLQCFVQDAHRSNLTGS